MNLNLSANHSWGLLFQPNAFKWEKGGCSTGHGGFREHRGRVKVLSLSTESTSLQLLLFLTRCHAFCWCCALQHCAEQRINRPFLASWEEDGLSEGCGENIFQTEFLWVCWTLKFTKYSEEHPAPFTSEEGFPCRCAEFSEHSCVCCGAGDTGILGGAVENNNCSKYQGCWMVDVERWELHSGTNRVGKGLGFFLQICLYLFPAVLLHRFIILLGLSIHSPGLSKGTVSCILFFERREAATHHQLCWSHSNGAMPLEKLLYSPSKKCLNICWSRLFFSRKCKYPSNCAHFILHIRVFPEALGSFSFISLLLQSINHHESHFHL